MKNIKPVKTKSVSASYKKNFFWKLFSIIMNICFIFIIGFFVIFFVIRGFVYPLKYEQQIVYFADQYNLDRALIFAICKEESSFNPDAESSANAKGLMQITQETGDYIAGILSVEEYDLKDARTNIEFGCFYVRYLLDKFNNVDTTLAAYNAGEGNVKLWLNNEEYSDDGITLKKIPYEETENFVKKVNKSCKKYKKYYKNIVDKSQNFV